MGDLILQCSSSPGAVLTGSLTMYLPVIITNRVNSSNQAADALLYVDYGSGFTPTGIPGVVSNNSITFSGYSFTTPASGRLTLKISGVRGGGFSLSGPSGQVTAAISANGLLLTQSQVVVAFAQTGLFATLYSKGVTCTGSPLPSTVTLPNLFSRGTVFFSTRLTEGFGSAFLVRGPGDDTGTRFIVNYTGFPAGAQLYVPDWVAGSDAAVPTAGGDLGLPQSGGQYVPGSGTLLLARVQNADSTGAGGFPVGAPTGAAVSFNTASQVTLTNGAGYVVYEVVDANNAAIESAQFPTFLGLSNVTAPSVAYESVSFAPVSTVTSASQTAPVPRFQSTTPGSDCSILGDCNAGYFPKLSVVTTPTIQLAGLTGGLMTSQPGYIPVNNTGGGIMNWTASIAYQNGAGWLTLDTTSGQNGGSVRVFASAATLTAGTYNATVIIDAGPLAGRVTIPVVFTVTTPAGGTSGGTSGATGSGGSATPPANAITVASVVNAATFEQTPVVAGSLASVMGKNLAGKTVSVTFDGAAANLLYTSATQINLQVPASLAGKQSVNMVVTVDGAASAPVTVAVSPAWPSIFNPGVLNQDNTVNGATVPAKGGDIIQIYATGIPSGATVWASIGGSNKQIPLYAGDAPGIAGVQQVNVAIPAGVRGASTPLYLCASANGQQYCSNTYNLAIQ
jgi:uncharacterized protein (TIGR03437 family)